MLSINKTRLLRRMIARARRATRRGVLTVRTALRQLRQPGFAWRRWWLPASGALLALAGMILAGPGRTPEPLAQPELIAISAADSAAAAGVSGGIAVVATDEPAVSEFEQMMRARAARNLRLLEFSLVGVGILIAIGALAYRFGSV